MIWESKFYKDALKKVEEQEELEKPLGDQRVDVKVLYRVG